MIVKGSHAPQYLIDRILHTSLLSVTEVSPDELFRLQVEKLVINSIVNPLTVLLNCRNGELFTHLLVVKLIQYLLLETSQVIQHLPQISTDPESDNVSRFSPQTLAGKVVEAVEKTAGNTSSMLQDFRAGRETEIKFINGFIVALGRELGMDVEMNERLVAMVTARVQISADEVEEHFRPGILTC
jgi:2-dehydropantoate 2-reductase